MGIDSSDLIEQIYSAGFAVERWQCVVDSMHSMMPHLPIALFGYDNVANISTGTVSAGFSDSDLLNYNGYFAPLSPFIPGMMRTPAGQIIKTDQCCDSETLVQSEYYNDFLAPIKLGGGVGIISHNDTSRLLITTINCSLNDRETEGKKMSNFSEVIANHISRAFGLMRKLAAEKVTMQNYEQMLQHVPDAAFIVDHRGQLVSCNAKGQSMLNRRQVLSIKENKIAFENLSAHTRFGKALDAITRRDYASLKMDVLLQSEDGTFLPSLYPFSSGFEELERPFHVLVDRQAFALLIISNLTERQKIDLTLTQTLFGLTPAEIRLSQAMLDGNDLQSYADKSMLSVLTVRNQLKSIFSKTSTSRQGELIALLARVRGT